MKTHAGQLYKLNINKVSFLVPGTVQSSSCVSARQESKFVKNVLNGTYLTNKNSL